MLSDPIMYGRRGAYSSTNSKIYLNKDWLETATLAETTQVLNEEFGHYLDQHFNSKDTKGNEGEHFAELLARSHQGLAIDSPTKTEIDADNDHGVIVHLGREQKLVLIEVF